MSNTLPSISSRAADWFGKDTSTLMRVARERALTGDRAINPTPAGSQPALIVAAALTGIAALWCLTSLPAAVGTRLTIGVVSTATAVTCGAYAWWGYKAVHVIERVTHWMRGLVALALSGLAIVLIVASTQQLLAVQNASDGVEPLVNGSVLAMLSLICAAGMALTCPPALSVAVVAPRHVSLLRLLLPLLLGFGSGALLANSITLTTSLTETGDSLGTTIGVILAIAGVISAWRTRYRSSVKTLEEAFDAVYVALTTSTDAETRSRAWHALARALTAGGGPAGWRGNRLLDRHIGSVLAIVMWKLAGIAPHLPLRTRTTILQHMTRHRVDVTTDQLQQHALELIAELRYRLVES
ncbi:hypothetical protein [Curtobacterium luteum]|uniref:hypothetical protein n=1 Tax=Curtobacterium luteum TaxID=33881 RepID=UPI00381AD277